MVMRFADTPFDFREPDYDEMERRRLERERAATAAVAPPPVTAAPLAPVPVAPIAPVRVSTAPFDPGSPLAGDDPYAGGNVSSDSPSIIFGPNIGDAIRSPNEMAAVVAEYDARQATQAGLDAMRMGGANSQELAAINARPVTDPDGYEIQRDPLTGGIIGYRAPGDANFTLDRRPSTAQELMSAPTFEEYISRAANAEFGSPDRAFALANSNFAVDPFQGRTFQAGPSLAQRRENDRLRNEGEARQAAFEAENQRAFEQRQIQPGAAGAGGGQLGDRYVEQGGTTIRTNREGTELARMGPDGQWITAPTDLPPGTTVTEQGSIVDQGGNIVGRRSTLGGYPGPAQAVTTPAIVGTPQPQDIASQNRAAVAAAQQPDAPVLAQTATSTSGQGFDVVGQVTSIDGEKGFLVRVGDTLRLWNNATKSYEDEWEENPKWMLR